jgi:hypothetical protein
MTWRLQDAAVTSTSTSRPAKTDATIYEDLVKTIYDPSPAGFVVPNYGLLYLLDGLTWSRVETTTLDGTEIPLPIPYVVANAGTANEVKFFLIGCRRQLYTADNDVDQDGNVVTSDHFGLTDFKQNSYLHTALTYYRGFSAAYIFMRGGTGSTLPDIRTGTASPARRPSRGFAVRPVKDKHEEVQAVGSTAQKYYREVDVPGIELTQTTGNSTDVTIGFIRETKEAWGIDDISTNSDFTKSVEVVGTGIYTTLNDVINSTAYTEKKVYVNNVRVYFTYDDAIYRGRTTTAFRVRINPKWGTEDHSDLAYVPESTLGTKVSGTNPTQYYWDFTPHWQRLRFTDLTDWQDIIPFQRLYNVSIVRVVADVKLTYVEEITP